MLTALALLPLLTTGQLGTLTVTVGDGAKNVNISPPQCGTNISAAWTVTFSGFPCTEGLTFWVTSTGTCGSAIAAGDLALQSVSQASLSTTRTGTVSIPVSSLFGLNSDAGTSTCGAPNISLTDQVCGAFTVDTTAACITKQTITGTVIPTITYDSVPPEPPSLGTVDAFDGTITVPVTVVSSDTSTYQMYTATAYDDGGMSAFTPFGDARAASVTNATLSGLTNGVTYFINATATDTAGNISTTHGNIVSGTPEPTTGFWGAYRADGGVAQGCSSAPGALAFSALALIAVAMLRRRRS